MKDNVPRLALAVPAIVGAAADAQSSVSPGPPPPPPPVAVQALASRASRSVKDDFLATQPSSACPPALLRGVRCLRRSLQRR